MLKVGQWLKFAAAHSHAWHGLRSKEYGPSEVKYYESVKLNDSYPIIIAIILQLLFHNYDLCVSDHLPNRIIAVTYIIIYIVCSWADHRF